MIEALKHFILQNRIELKLSNQISNRISALLISGSVGAQGKVVFLFFSDRKKTPFLIAKIARDQRYIEYLRNEYNNLLELQKIVPEDIKQSLPEPLYFGKIGADTVLFETSILGERIEKIIQNETSIRSNGYLDLVLSWIEQFNLFTKSDFLISDERNNQILYDPIQDFVSNFKLNKLEEDTIKDAKRQLERMKNTNIPLVFVHGELWPGNAFFYNNKLGFIDWECSRNKGLPYFDLFTFFVSYCRILFNSGHFIPLKEIFSAGSYLKKILRTYLNNYSDVIGLDREFCRLFFILYLIKHSNIEYEFRLADMKKGYLRDTYISSTVTSISEAIKNNLRYFNFFKHAVKEKVIISL